MPPNTAPYSGFRAVDLSQRPATAVQVAAMLSTSSACAAMLIVLPSDRFEPLWLPATLREALAACKAKPALCVAAALIWANDAGGLPSGSEVRKAAAATALLPPAPRAMAMVTRSSGGASLNTDLSLYQTAIQSRLHLVSHGSVSCKPDGDCGFNAASQLQCRSSHLSCSIDNLTGVGQGQQQDMQQLAANVLRTNTSLQKALCHPEVETDVFDTWKALLPGLDKMGFVSYLSTLSGEECHLRSWMTEPCIRSTTAETMLLGSILCRTCAYTS
ncbi:TPA: hypothetical protein ACH3X2_006286 [Trebouxia sp. C0005]